MAPLRATVPLPDLTRANAAVVPSLRTPENVPPPLLPPTVNVLKVVPEELLVTVPAPLKASMVWL